MVRNSPYTSTRLHTDLDDTFGWNRNPECGLLPDPHGQG
jgi:hypothetical protein